MGLRILEDDGRAVIYQSTVEECYSPIFMAEDGYEAFEVAIAFLDFGGEALRMGDDSYWREKVAAFRAQRHWLTRPEGDWDG